MDDLSVNLVLNYCFLVDQHDFGYVLFQFHQLLSDQNKNQGLKFTFCYLIFGLKIGTIHIYI